MNFDFITSQIILSFLLGLTRVSGMMMMSPILSIGSIPGMIRIGIASVITLSFYDLMMSTSQNLILTDYVHLTLALFHELLIGAIIGFVFKLFFDALLSFADTLATQSGQNSSHIFMPGAAGNASSFAVLINNFSMFCFLSIGGLYSLLILLKKSFQLIPLASYSLNLAIFAENLLGVFNSIFLTALNIILPLIAIMFILDVFVALFARIMPQAGMFILLMPTKILFALFVLSLVLNSISASTEIYFTETVFDLLEKLFS